MSRDFMLAVRFHVRGSRFQRQRHALEMMAPFRWPTMENDLSLAKEVAGRRPKTPHDWDEIAISLSRIFSTIDKEIELKGRGCRERMERLLEKYQQDDKKALKKSGTEEEFDELNQLLEDIFTFKRDSNELKAKETREKEQKKKKESEDKRIGQEMRKKAMEGLAKRKQCESSSEDEHSLDDEDCENKPSNYNRGPRKGKITRKKATRLSVVQMLQEKNDKKADLKEKELHLRSQELELQKKKFEEEAIERKEKLKLELEERRMYLQLMKDRL